MLLGVEFGKLGDFGNDTLFTYWLNYKVVRSCFIVFVPGFGVGLLRENDDVRLLSRLLLPHLENPDHFETIYTGHLNVNQGEVKIGLSGLPDHLFGIIRKGYLPTKINKDVFGEFPAGGVVVGK